ncbi:unnamed protein product, partial [Prorocentrum cordatum]
DWQEVRDGHVATKITPEAELMPVVREADGAARFKAYEDGETPYFHSLSSIVAHWHVATAMGGECPTRPCQNVRFRCHGDKQHCDAECWPRPGTSILTSERLNLRIEPKRESPTQQTNTIELAMETGLAEHVDGPLVLRAELLFATFLVHLRPPILRPSAGANLDSRSAETPALSKCVEGVDVDADAVALPAGPERVRAAPFPPPDFARGAAEARRRTGMVARVSRALSGADAARQPRSALRRVISRDRARRENSRPSRVDPGNNAMALDAFLEPSSGERRLRRSVIAALANGCWSNKLIVGHCCRGVVRAQGSARFARRSLGARRLEFRWEGRLRAARRRCRRAGQSGQRENELAVPAGISSAASGVAAAETSASGIVEMGRQIRLESMCCSTEERSRDRGGVMRRRAWWSLALMAGLMEMTEAKMLIPRLAISTGAAIVAVGADPQMLPFPQLQIQMWPLPQPQLEKANPDSNT